MSLIKHPKISTRNLNKETQTAVHEQAKAGIGQTEYWTEIFYSKTLRIATITEHVLGERNMRLKR